MKKLLFTVLALVVVGSVYGQSVVKCDAKIYAADIYPDGAKLYLRGNVNLKKGVNQIEITDIPQSAFGQTLRVGIAGGGVTIHSSMIQYNEKSGKPDAQIEKFYSQIDALRTDSELALLKMKTIDEQLAILKEQCSVSKEAVKPSVEYVASVVDVLGKKMNELQGMRYELSAKIQSNKKEISKIEEQKTEYSNKRSEINNVVTIVAQSDAEKTASIGAEFVVSGAGWSPYYEVQIDGTKCEVVTKAKVSQNVGLDWNGVQLNLLSSNIGANSTALPVVYSEYIPADIERWDDYEINASVQVRPNAQKMSEQEESVGYFQKEQYAAAPTMALSSKSYNVENFKLTAPYSIACNGQVDIKLTSQSIPMVMEYLIMPTESRNAYLVANLTTADIFNRATANIYLDGTFIGTQPLTPYQIAENNQGVVIKLSLGIDKEVVVKTEPTNLSKANVTSTSRKTTVVNNKDKAINVKVVERHPISTQSAVKVDNVVISEGWTQGNDAGIINWVFKLPAGEKAEKSISYNVKDGRK